MKGSLFPPSNQGAAMSIGKFWYLGSPYAKYPGGIEAANEVACQAAGLLMGAGIPVFCPIAHSHSVSQFVDLPRTHEFWLAVDQTFIDAAYGMIALHAESWEDSMGMSYEIREFVKARKPLVPMMPGKLPPIDSLKVFIKP